MIDEYEPDPPTDEEIEQMRAEYEAFLSDEPEPLTDEELDRLIAQHEEEIALEEAEEAERAANAPTVEEMEAKFRTRSYHMENFQYIDRTHTNKEDALEHKRLANPKHRKSVNDPAFHTMYFSFDELVNQHRNGMTFRRLPYKATDAETYTQMLFMDIDDDKIKSKLGNHITAEELSTLLESEFPGNWQFTPSTSGTPFNYHVFIFLDEPVLCTKDSYYQMHDHAESVLCKRLRLIRNIPDSEKKFFITDPAGRSPLQTFYGCSQPEERKIELKTTELDAATGRFFYREPAAHLERSDKTPMPVPADHIQSTMPYTKNEWLAKTVPTSPTQLVNILKQSGDINSGRIEMPYGFRAWLPYMKHGASKIVNPIEIGERNRRVSLFALQLYNVFRASNWFLIEQGLQPFTQEELLNSFQDYVSRAYKESYDFHIATYRDRLQDYAKSNSRYTDAEWCEKCAKFAIRHGRRNRNLITDERPVRTVFRSKNFCSEESSKILQKFASGDNVATFGSKSDLLNVLKEYDVSYTTFVKHAKSMGYTIEYKVGPGGSRSGSGRTPTVTIEAILKRIGGTLTGKTVSYTGTLGSKDRVWLSRHKYIVRKVVT